MVAIEIAFWYVRFLPLSTHATLFFEYFL